MEKNVILPKINSIYFLCTICVIAVIFRLYFFDESIPLNLDSLNFFLYSADIVAMGKLPENYDVAKPGWSYILAIIFSLFNFEYTLQYMQLQKFMTIFISSLTTIPLFFLIRKFSSNKYSLLGILLFAVEPRIIQNSLSGNSEPIFIFCMIVTMLLFLNKNNRIVYLSFLIAGISTIIRPEGLFLFIGISISYIVRFRKHRYLIPKYIIAFSFFILILIPVSLHKQQEGMYDSVFERAYYTLVDNETYEQKSRQIISTELNSIETKSNIFILSAEYFSKYLAWVLIPLFILVTPIGFILFLKNLNIEKFTILVLTVTMSIPALYAYTFPLLETKYLYFLFPMFCIFATFSFQSFFKKFKNEYLLFTICFILIISTSMLFLDYKFDYKKEKESVIIANYVLKNTKTINNYFPESAYLTGVGMPEKWEDYKLFYKNTDRNIGSIKPHLPITILEPNNYETLDSFLKNDGKQIITHLVLDGKNSRPEFLNDIFYNENKYNFNKIYDSRDNGLEYHVKIFEVK